MWDVDQIGYNFCHRIRLNSLAVSFRTAGLRCEVRYWITLTTGETVRRLFPNKG